MTFFYRRKPKPPSSTFFTPLLKLFKTEYSTAWTRPSRPAPVEDSGSPILLSGPKSRYGLGIGLHFIAIPKHPRIDANCVWKYARKEMYDALIQEGVSQAEADMFTRRFIDLLQPPVEIVVEIEPEDKKAIEDFRRLINYQLLLGQNYDGTTPSISQIYGELIETFTSVQAKEKPGNPDAATELDGIILRNVSITIRQEDIEKKTILDIEGKLKEAIIFFKMFTESRYLKRATPQEPLIIQQLYK
ncbi:MAG: hypothetical protein ACFFDP_00885 [Promethearchaeota archaeon]